MVEPELVRWPLPVTTTPPSIVTLLITQLPSTVRPPLTVEPGAGVPPLGQADPAYAR
jgi:hypothetical protein